MIGSLQRIMSEAIDRLAGPAAAFLPRLIAAALILLAGFVLAALARWVAARTIKAARVDRFLAQSGLASMLGISAGFRAARATATLVYWTVLVASMLIALNALDTSLTSRIIESAVVLAPKLVTAGAIILAGLWVGQYLGRSTLVWACNEGLRRPRVLASGVRAGVMVVAVVAAADHLDFARSVFLAGFIIVFGGAVLALSLAFGGAAKEWLGAEREERLREREETSLWNHL